LLTQPVIAQISAIAINDTLPNACRNLAFLNRVAKKLRNLFSLNFRRLAAELALLAHLPTASGLRNIPATNVASENPTISNRSAILIISISGILIFSTKIKKVR